MGETKRGGAASSDATKAKLIEAALACLRDEGIAGLSARAIARHGDVNQALIFYHFGSVDGLLVAAALHESKLRATRYADQLAGVNTLPELVTVARTLHDTEERTGSLVMLVQLMAGAARSDQLRDGVFRGFRPWMDLVEATIERVISGTPIAALGIPVSDMTLAISSLFLGVELITGMDTDSRQAASLFDTMAKLAMVIDALMGMIPADAITAAPPA